MQRGRTQFNGTKQRRQQQTQEYYNTLTRTTNARLRLLEEASLRGVHIR